MKTTTTGETVVTFTFPVSGTAVESYSLADGRYTLTVFAAQIEQSILLLDGNGDGTPGDDYVLVGNPTTALRLFRLYGDYNGDGTVELSDFLQFRLYLGGTGTVFDYHADNAIAADDFIQFRLALGGNSNIFDFDNDGAVAASDFIQFRLRFGGSI